VSNRLDRARDFMARHARLLERQRFACAFEGADKAGVIAALAAYQNADGGFGNALEPDKRTPFSQPQDVEIAFHVLDEIGAMDHPMVARACDWLASISTEAGGVPFSLPSVNAFPHAPWWGVEEGPQAASINPTAALVGLLDKHRVAHRWAEPAAEFCWVEIERTGSTQFHDLMPMVHFLENAFDRPRAERALKRIAEIIATPGVVEPEPAAAGYVKKPLDWAPAPHCFCRRLFDDALIAKHLDALASQQQEDGGWPISWETVSPAVTIEWRGMVTLNALKTLAEYGFRD